MLYTYLLKILLNGLGVYLCTQILDGVKITGFGRALVTALLLSLVNLLIKPLILFLSYPITLLTLGLFSFVIDGFIILIVSAIYPHFKVKGFVWAIVFSILLSIINTLLHWIFIS